MGTGRAVRRHPMAHAVSLKLPLPLAALCCFVFFFAGSFFGGKQYAGLPDMKQPRKKVATATPLSASTAQQQHHQQQQQVSGSRRQLASHTADDNQVALKGEGDDLPIETVKSPSSVYLSLPSPYPHGQSGEPHIDAIAMQMLSWKPRAYIFPGFAPTEICDSIVALAKKHLAPSGLALRSGETAEGTRDIRTSSGAFLSSRSDPSGALKWVEQKMARITMVPSSHGEAFNVLRYELGQHYDSHMDVFDPKEYGPQGSNRVASFLLYLTDVEEGGETMFPYEGGKNMNIGYNFKDCIGLRVKPRKGDALLFWSMFPNGKIDPHSLHGSCPVTKGEKWVATKWIRDKGGFYG